MVEWTTQDLAVELVQYGWRIFDVVERRERYRNVGTAAGEMSGPTTQMTSGLSVTSPSVCISFS